MGHEGIYCNSTVDKKKVKCFVCEQNRKFIKVEKSMLLKEFIEKIKKELDVVSPALYLGNQIIYMPKPEAIEEHHRFKLDLSFEQLKEKNIFSSGETLIITDENGTFYVKLTVV